MGIYINFLAGNLVSGNTFVCIKSELGDVKPEKGAKDKNSEKKPVVKRAPGDEERAGKGVSLKRGSLAAGVENPEVEKALLSPNGVVGGVHEFHKRPNIKM